MANYPTTTYLIEDKQIGTEQLVFRGCQFVSVLSAFYLTTEFVTGNMENIVLPDFLMSLLQCFLGMSILYVPSLVKKVAKINMPDALCSFFYVFVVCGTVLGEAFSLYYVIPLWDSILHFGSGIMSGMLGGILLVTFLQKEHCEKLITPVVVVTSIICFAMCIGVLWEIFEFAADSLLGVNMQKWMLQDGTELIGRSALLDTMKDLVVDLTGATVAAITACSSLKQKKGWLINSN